MYFHRKLAWPHATHDIISRNHSNWPSLNLSQNLREGWTNSYWKRQVLMFYPLGKNWEKPYRAGGGGKGGGIHHPHPLYVRGFIQELVFRIPMQWEPRIPDSTLFLERWVIFMNLIVINTDRFAFGVESSSMLWIKKLILHGASVLESSGWSFDSIDDVLNLEKLPMFSPSFGIISKPLKARKRLIALRMWVMVKNERKSIDLFRV